MTGSRRPEPPLEILAGLRHPVPLEEGHSVSSDRRRASIEAMARAIRTDRGRAQRARRFALYGVAAGILLLAGFGWVWHARSGAQHEIASQVANAPARTGSELHVTAGLVVATHQGRATAVAVGSAVAVVEGDEIQSAADGEARLLLPRGVRVELGGSTKTLVGAVSEQEQRLRCNLGTTRVSVPKPGGPRTFAVETPDAEVIVHGTEFSVLVERDPSEASTVTSVSVTRGAVLVVYRGEQRLIEAGNHWSSRATGSALLGQPPGQEALATGATAISRTGQAEATGGTIAPARPINARGSLAEQNRLFRAALDAKKRGNDARALDYLDELLTRFPNTTLSHEAQLARARALERLGQTPTPQRGKD